jgi:capsular polysaccharide transport system permease protein
MLRSSSIVSSPKAISITAGSAAKSASASGRRRNILTRLSFIGVVVIPTAAAALYFSLIATQCYLSDTKFLVRGVSSSRVSGIDAFFRVFGISRAVDDANVINDFILSRDAVRELEARVPLRTIFSRPEADSLARFPRFWERDDFESLYRYYLQRVSIVDDASKGITTLRVNVFRPQDAESVARELLSLAENVVNQMNLRAQRDTIVAAQKTVDEAEHNVQLTQAALTKFRNGSLLIDPTKKSESDLKTMGGLWTELTQTLEVLREKSVISPASPDAPVLVAKIDALRQLITSQRDEVKRGESLGEKVSVYENLTLARDLAEKSLSAAVDSLEVARQESRRQQIYVEEVAAPNLPDESTEPERLRSVATVFVLTFSIFSVLWILSVGANEHKQ